MEPQRPVDRFLRLKLDPLIERLLRYGVQLGIPDPVRARLVSHRRKAQEETSRVFSARAQSLAEAVAAREPTAIHGYDALVDEAFAHMRGRRPQEGGKVALCDAIERRLYKNGAELLDDPDFPRHERARALDGLHRLNVQIGSYESFLAALLPLIEAAEARGRSPVRIHDLASGHGGFALYLKQTLGERVMVEASDIKDEYLELGRARAGALGVDVRFVVEDALAIEHVKERGVDLITCTQAIHHFPPGMVARMLGEAARAAEVGVCFIDGVRSWIMYGLIGVSTAIYGRSYVLFHDGLVSLRRMFHEEELALFASLAPGLPASTAIETGSIQPNHAFVRLLKATPELSV